MRVNIEKLIIAVWVVGCVIEADQLEDLKSKLEQLRTREQTQQDDSFELKDVLESLKREEKTDEQSINAILSKKCKTAECQRRKNDLAVNIILSKVGDNDNKKVNLERDENRKKLSALSAELDRLIPTRTEISLREQPRSLGLFSRQVEDGPFFPRRRRPNSRHVLVEDIPKNLKRVLPFVDDNKNVFIFSLQGSQNPRFLFD